MVQVLLTHTYILANDPKQKRIGEPYAPLGTLYAASVLRDIGVSFMLHDITFGTDAENLIPVIEEETPQILVIYDDSFSYLSKMCLTNMRNVALRMSEIARGAGCKVIISSSDSSDNLELYLNNNVDFIIIGEGEITLGDLISRLVSIQPDKFDDIAGLAFQRDGLIVKTPSRTNMENPDLLPFPAWDLLDAEAYRKVWMSNKGYFAVNMVTARGCPYNCIWCAKPVYSNHYSSRSALNVVTEMLYLKSTLSPDRIWFADDIFGLKPQWVEEFAREIGASGLNIPYSIQSRVDLILRDNMIEGLHRSGCRKIWLGIESGSQKILDAMQKGITIEQVRAASPLLRFAGISQAFFIQLGFPGENSDDIAKTINLLNELIPDDIGISISYPLPGTPFHERVKGMEKTHLNWKDSDDLALLFESTYSPLYYKTLHRYIHKNFRFRQGLHFLKTWLNGKGTTDSPGFRRIMLIPWYLTTSMMYKVLLISRKNIGRIRV